MGELYLDGKEFILIISELCSDEEVVIEIEDEVKYVNKSEAEQIIKHLQEQFNLTT